MAITLAAAVYQRRTGPTELLKGAFQAGESTYSYKLPRTHGGPGDQEVRIPVPDDAQATLYWRHFPTDWDWRGVPMEPSEGELTAWLPHQPPAGKLEYYVVIDGDFGETRVPEGEQTAIIRFKGAVPAGYLVPHVIFMFAAMLVSNRAGLETLRRNARTAALTYVTMGCMVLGGLVFGPIVQHYAFGQAWTGFPVGHDLTDNKLAVAAAFWLIPFIQHLRKKRAERWVLLAALVTFIIFLIPHSLLGSELDWSETPPPGVQSAS